MSQLVSELERQRTSLIQDFVIPFQASEDALCEMVNHFNGRLAATEPLARENFEHITSTEKTVTTLQAQNKPLQDRHDELVNRSSRTNLQIFNIPEDSEKGRGLTEFISDLLMDNLGPDILSKPLELKRDHRSF